MPERIFTLAEARALLPEVLLRADAIVRVRADLAELGLAVQGGASSRLGGVPELKGLQARLHDELDWLAGQGLQVKGVAPLLLDLPSMLAGESMLLCWLEGERELAWYHRPELGFLGRRPLPP
jgi:hypothetical protein